MSYRSHTLPLWSHYQFVFDVLLYLLLCLTSDGKFMWVNKWTSRGKAGFVSKGLEESVALQKEILAKFKQHFYESWVD